MLFSQCSLTVIFQTPGKVLGCELNPEERKKKKKEKYVPPEDSQLALVL